MLMPLGYLKGFLYPKSVPSRASVAYGIKGILPSDVEKLRIVEVPIAKLIKRVCWLKG